MAKFNYEIILAIGAVLAGAYLIYKIAPSLSTSIESIGTGIGGGINNLLSGFGSVGVGLGSGLASIGGGLGSGVSSIGAGFGSVGVGLGAGLSDIGAGLGYGISGTNLTNLLEAILGNKNLTTPFTTATYTALTPTNATAPQGQVNYMGGTSAPKSSYPFLSGGGTKPSVVITPYQGSQLQNAISAKYPSKPLPFATTPAKNPYIKGGILG